MKTTAQPTPARNDKDAGSLRHELRQHGGEEYGRLTLDIVSRPGSRNSVIHPPSARRILRPWVRLLAWSSAILMGLSGSASYRGLNPATSTIEFQDPAVAGNADGPETIVDKTPDELVRAMPELAGLEPAAGEKILTEILKKVGENVKAYFHNYLSTSAREETEQERLQLDGQVEETFKQEYRYLVVTHPGNGPSDWDEYRTDDKGQPADTTSERNAVLTKRFAYVPIYLHSDYQDDSDFNYLGMQNVDGHRCHVIAFAQWPARARLFVKLTDGPISYKVFLQGLAWIDASSYQIIRMYTELLPDASVRGVKQQTTEVTFTEVHFKGIAVALWLPREVVVNTNWAGKKYRNYHRYSDYKLFRSETKLVF